MTEETELAFIEIIPPKENRDQDYISNFAKRKKMSEKTAVEFLEFYDNLFTQTNDKKKTLAEAYEKFKGKINNPANQDNNSSLGKEEPGSPTKEHLGPVLPNESKDVKQTQEKPENESTSPNKEEQSSPTKEPVPPNNTKPNAQTKNDKISLTKEQKNSSNQNDQSSPAKEQQNETQNDENSPTKEPVPPTQHAETKPQVKSSPNKEQQKEDKHDENSSSKEENKSPNSPAKEKRRGTARQRAIQNLLSKKTEEALSVSITKEEKEEGDKTLKKVIDDLLTQWTLIDTLADHKQDIKLLRERGHSDATICQKFQEAYPKFGTIPTEYVEMALSRKSARR